MRCPIWIGLKLPKYKPMCMGAKLTKTANEPESGSHVLYFLIQMIPQTRRNGGKLRLMRGLVDRDEDAIGILLADAEIITGNLNGHWVTERSYHFHPYGFTRYAAHLHQGKLEAALFMRLDDSLLASG